jgi:hypothetical protein
VFFAFLSVGDAIGDAVGDRVVSSLRDLSRGSRGSAQIGHFVSLFPRAHEMRESARKESNAELAKEAKKSLTAKYAGREKHKIQQRAASYESRVAGTELESRV